MPETCVGSSGADLGVPEPRAMRETEVRGTDCRDGSPVEGQKVCHLSVALK